MAIQIKQFKHDANLEAVINELRNGGRFRIYFDNTRLLIDVTGSNVKVAICLNIQYEIWEGNIKLLENSLKRNTEPVTLVNRFWIAIQNRESHEKGLSVHEAMKFLGW